MFSEIKKLVDQLSNKSEIQVLTHDSSWEISVNKLQKYKFKIIIPFSVLEWYVALYSLNIGKEIWSDWIDYKGYDNKNYSIKYEIEMCSDIEWFLNTMILVTDIRIIEKKFLFLFKKKSVEWLLNGSWRNILISAIKD